MMVVSKILAYVDMISTYLCKPPKREKKSVTNSVARWAPPPPGWVCINVDAALFPNDRRMGCGAVLRDHRGGFILSISEGLDCFPSPEVAEVLAARHALMVALDHGVKQAVLVSDCLSLTQHIVSPRRDRSSLGSVISDIKSLLAGLESCSVKFASRNLNVVAHKLARSAEPSVCNISVSVIPELIRDELMLFDQ
jgi:ribonuclease HI